MNVPLPLRILLWPLSLVYGAYVRARAWLYEEGYLEQRRLRSRVISVGNLTVGGTGKTPMVMWLAEKFLAEGKRVAILSRGYRGAGGTSDEIELMKQRLGNRAAFGVGKNRFAEGLRIEAQGPVDIFLLDDGFQHLQLARDLDIVMLDGTRKLKNEWLLPAGHLREPIAACRRADLLVVTRKTERPEIEVKDSHRFSIFYAQTLLLGFRQLGGGDGLHYVSEIGPGPFFAFCGIGNPQAFFDDLERWHVPVAGKRSFRDHHRYSLRDVDELKREALPAGAIAFVTTEKDACNLQDAKGLELPVYVAVIEMVISSESEFDAALERKLAAASGASA
jgi:tetraacyldisaccharide 4'-kinase